MGNEKSRVWKWFIALKMYQSTHLQFSVGFQKFPGPSTTIQVYYKVAMDALFLFTNVKPDSIHQEAPCLLSF